MLLILVLLFFPCALVGAFVTAEEYDLTAFQTVFSCRPLEGALHGCSSAVSKDASSTRHAVSSRSAVTARRTERTSPVTMLIGGPTSLPTSRAFGGGGGVGSSGSDCPAPCPSSTVLIWPGAAAGGGGVFGGATGNYGGTGSSSSHHPARRRTRGRSFCAGSESALQAMAIPARCALPSVDLLRQAYGPRRSFWGDLSAAETRRFYHELLPVSVYLEALCSEGVVAGAGKDMPLGGGMSGGGLATVVDGVVAEGGDWMECIFGAAETLEERARLASMARHAARLYVRERCKLPSRVLAHLYDGLRHLKNYGSFRVTGMTWEQLWEKYEKQIRLEDPSLEGEDLKTSICLRILEKSCCTSEVFNNLSGCSELNTFLPDASVCATEEMRSSSGDVGVGVRGGAAVVGDDALCLDAGGSTPMLLASADSVCDEAPKGAESKELERAYAAESAAACAGALRLTRLVRPFSSQDKLEGDDGEGAAEKKTEKRGMRRPLGRPRFCRRVAPSASTTRT